MLVKNVQRYFPWSTFEGFNEIKSIEIIFADIRTVKRINAITLIIIKVVFKLIESKKFLLFFGLI
jgi:hypothetical protein